MNFGQALQALKQGECLTRENWVAPKFVCKQVPSVIGTEIVQKMQSLPEKAKEIILSNESAEGIAYKNQLLVVNSINQADSYTPSTADLFAEDWQIITDE